MRIFLTGGTGFIGSHFIVAALNAGHEVIAVRRPGSVPRLPLVNQPVWIDRHLDQSFDEFLKDVDVVVHLAAHTANPPYASLKDCLYWNLLTPVGLFDQAQSAGVGKFLVAGTCFEYGDAALGQDFIHPSTPLSPKLTYPISKAAASIAFQGLARQANLQVKVLRIFQVFGEGETPTRFWPSLRKAALSGQDFSMSSGIQIRDFIPVELVARQLLENLDFSDVKPGRPLTKNIGTGVGTTLLDFARHWWGEFSASGRLIPGGLGLRPGEDLRIVANIRDVYE
jgi:nucleoside-diphosphate-sugar epimerase